MGHFKSAIEQTAMLFLCLALLAAPCLSKDIVDTLVGDSKASTLVSLVTKAGLASTLKGAGPFTVFAPTDAAFSAVDGATLNSLLADPTGALADLLKYHVLSGKVMSSDISDEQIAGTVAGDNVRLNIYSHNHIVTINGKKISTVDVQCDNGVIHFIDGVIMPTTKNIVQVISDDPELSTLLSLVQSAGIADEFRVDPLTVFAPTNAAFSKVSSADLAKLGGDKNRLKETLEYHGVPHTLFASGLYNREFEKSVDSHEDRLRIRVGSDGVTVNNGKVVQADLQAMNGVVHKIDHVLIPLRVGFWLKTGIGRK